MTGAAAASGCAADCGFGRKKVRPTAAAAASRQSSPIQRKVLLRRRRRFRRGTGSARFGAKSGCGSAGTYSILQPELSARLRDNKLAALNAGNPAVVATANIGCLTHLQAGSPTPVRHWVELLDEILEG